MELLLWRHAAAVQASPELADRHRPLSELGQCQARRVAHWLNSQELRSLRILVSPAVRCQQTAQALALPFETDERLSQNADVADLLAAAHWPQGYGKHGGMVLLVSHQPALGRLASLLMCGQEADWSIKKGALWWLSLRKRSGDAQVVLKAVIDASLT